MQLFIIKKRLRYTLGEHLNYTVVPPQGKAAELAVRSPDNKLLLVCKNRKVLESQSGEGFRGSAARDAQRSDTRQGLTNKGSSCQAALSRKK